MKEITVQLTSPEIKKAINEFKQKLSAEGYINTTIYTTQNRGHDAILYSEMETDAMMLATSEQIIMLLANNLGVDVIDIAKIMLKHAKMIKNMARNPMKHLDILAKYIKEGNPEITIDGEKKQ